jgi:predicted enzyme related to lactoylglutathione lyase
MRDPSWSGRASHTDNLGQLMKKLISWFDIPVSDMGRAVKFYEEVTGQKLQRLPVATDRETALFPSDGCLFRAPEDKPSHHGSRVYLNAESGIGSWLERIEAAGGKTLVPKTPIGSGRGFFAYFEDSEGNRVGLHGPG